MSFGLVWAEFECTLHVPLCKQPINQLKPVEQSRKQALGGYCPNIYNIILCLERPRKNKGTS